jgi:hypothetical protein
MTTNKNPGENTNTDEENQADKGDKNKGNVDSLTVWDKAWESLSVLNPVDRLDAWLVLTLSVAMSVIVISFKGDEWKLRAATIYILVFTFLMFGMLVKSKDREDARILRERVEGNDEKLKAKIKEQEKLTKKNIDDLESYRCSLKQIEESIPEGSDGKYHDVREKIKSALDQIDSLMETYEEGLRHSTDALSDLNRSRSYRRDRLAKLERDKQSRASSESLQRSD